VWHSRTSVARLPRFVSWRTAEREPSPVRKKLVVLGHALPRNFGCRKKTAWRIRRIRFHDLRRATASEIDRLRFGTAPANDLSSELDPSAANRNRLLTTDSQAPRSASSASREGSEFSEEIRGLTVAGWTGLEPAASGVTGRRYNQA
jgi:hypothetical protein